MTKQYQLSISTPGRGMINLTNSINEFVTQSGISVGLCHLFLHHTSASLTLCENTDPLVQSDAEAFMRRIAPDGDPLFEHVCEGPDDMPSHIRTMLTQSFLSIPITNGRLVLGTWQGIYLWEHRLNSFKRKITITVM